MDDWIECLYKWQTLAAGLIALVGALCAAGWTVHKINKQINLQKESFDEDKRRHNEAIMRKELVARAELPDALTEILKFASNIVTECVEKLENGKKNNDEGTEIFQKIDYKKLLSQPPKNSINIIKTCIEYANADYAPYLLRLVLEYQINNARLSDRSETIMSSDRINGHIADAAFMYYLVELIFPYARGQNTTVPKDAKDPKKIKAAVFNSIQLNSPLGMRVFPQQTNIFNEVYEIIDFRYGQEFEDQSSN
ncbi:hypothetical protein [Sneathiella sp.]|uniref:hypothetical protein n=1 Tax=Sneathiella sp. TaxID=1964365 RepID=UPI002608835A|nr:hypothetical protein [Sneathiella sp.]MDF2367230.1 hypothetical protein [Sneathiella sp.]